MATPFKNIGIIGRIHTSGVKETLKTLINYLQNLPLNPTLWIEAETAASLLSCELPIVKRELLGKQCDLVIVVGGDGSLLHASHDVIEDETPILGINRGSLGFLTDILPSQLEKIGDILAGKYVLEKRFLLAATVYHHDVLAGKDNALNEVAIIPDEIPHMIEFEIYVDNQFVCSQDSDGIIIATPTGSTAYALSGGGPILHPQLNAIVLVPMFPHSLSSRPIVIDGNSEIRIIISPENLTSPRASCDGRAYINALPGSHVVIKKKSKQLHLVHPLDYNYYETLRSKLHWGKKLHYTE